MSNIKNKLAAVLLAIIIPITAMSDPVSTIAGAAITSLTAKELIERADVVVKEGVAAANSAGVNIVTNVSESLNVALDNFKNVVDDQSGKTIGELSKERQAVAFSLAKSMNDVKEQARYLVGFGDMALLSLEHTIDSSILGAFSGDTIVVQKVLGRGQLETDDNNYNLGVIATNIGTGESGVSNNFELFIDGRKIDHQSNGLSRHKRTFSINNELMSQYFDPERVSNAFLTINVKQVHHGWVSLFDKIIEHDININLSLYPKKAGDLVVQYDLPTYRWSNIAMAEKRSRGQCHNCSTGSAFALTLQVSGGDHGESTPLNSERLVNVTCTCKSGSLCWYDEHGHAGAHVMNFSPHKNMASCNGHHRTRPTEWVLSGMRQKYVYGEPLSESKSVTFDFNKTIKVGIPKNAVSIRLTGKLITGEIINIGLDPLSDTSGQVVLSGSDSDGVNKNFFIEIKPKTNNTLGVF